MDSSNGLYCDPNHLRSVNVLLFFSAGVSLEQRTTLEYVVVPVPVHTCIVKMFVLLRMNTIWDPGKTCYFCFTLMLPTLLNDAAKYEPQPDLSTTMSILF